METNTSDPTHSGDKSEHAPPQKDEVFIKIGRLEKKGQFIWSSRYVALSRVSLSYTHAALPKSAVPQDEAEVSETTSVPTKGGLAKVDLDQVQAVELSDSNRTLSVICDSREKPWAVFRSSDLRTIIEWKDAISTVAKQSTIKQRKLAIESSLHELCARRIPVFLSLPHHLDLIIFRTRVCPALNDIAARLTAAAASGFRLKAPDDPESFDLPFLFNEFDSGCPRPLPQSLSIRLLYDSHHSEPDQLSVINSSRLADNKNSFDRDEGFRIFDVVARFVPEERLVVLCLPCNKGVEAEIPQLSLCIKILCKKFSTLRQDAAFRIFLFLKRFLRKSRKIKTAPPQPQLPTVHSRQSLSLSPASSSPTPTPTPTPEIFSDPELFSNMGNSNFSVGGDLMMEGGSQKDPTSIVSTPETTPTKLTQEDTVQHAKRVLLRFFKAYIFKRRLHIRTLLINEADQCVQEWFSSLPKTIGLLFFTDSHTLTLDYSTLRKCLLTFISRFFEIPISPITPILNSASAFGDPKLSESVDYESERTLMDVVLANFSRFESFLDSLVEKLSQDRALSFFVQHFRYYISNDQASRVPSWRFDFTPIEEKDSCAFEDSNFPLCSEQIIWPPTLQQSPVSPKAGNSTANNNIQSFFSASVERASELPSKESYVLSARNRADVPESVTFSFTIPIFLNREKFLIFDQTTMSKSVRDFLLRVRVSAIESHLQRMHNVLQPPVNPARPKAKRGSDKPIIRFSEDLTGCSEDEPWAADGHIRAFLRCITLVLREVHDGSWSRDAMSDLRGLVPIFHTMLASTKTIDLRTSFFDDSSTWEDPSVSLPSPVTVQTHPSPDGNDSYSLTFGFAKALGPDITASAGGLLPTENLRSSTPLSFVSTTFDMKSACEAISRSLRMRQLIYTLAASRLNTLLEFNRLSGISEDGENEDSQNLGDEEEGGPSCLMYGNKRVHITGIPGEIIFRVLCPPPSSSAAHHLHTVSFTSLANDHFAFGDTFESLPRLSLLSLSGNSTPPPPTIGGAFLTNQDYSTPPRNPFGLPPQPQPHAASGTRSSTPLSERASSQPSLRSAPSPMSIYSPHGSYTCFPEPEIIRNMCHALACLESDLPDRLLGTILDHTFEEERFLTQDVATPFVPITEVVFRNESFLKNADSCSMAYEPSCGRLTVSYRPELNRLQETEDMALKNKFVASLWLAFMNSGIEDKAWKARSFINTMYSLQQEFSMAQENEVSSPLSIDISCFFVPIQIPLLSSLLVDRDVQWWSDVLVTLFEHLDAKRGDDQSLVIQLDVDPASPSPLILRSAQEDSSNLVVGVCLFALKGILELEEESDFDARIIENLVSDFL